MFNIGQEVWLNSGSPKMKVISITRDVVTAEFLDVEYETMAYISLPYACLTTQETPVEVNYE